MNCTKLIMAIVVAIDFLCCSRILLAGSQLTAAAISRDNEILLLGDQAGTISAWRLSDGKQLWIAAGTGRPIENLGFSDPDKIVVVDGEQFIRTISARGASGTVLQLDYQYVTTEGRPAHTVASAVVEGHLALGCSAYARGFLLRTDRLESRLPYIFLDSIRSEELGLDYMHSVVTGPPSSAVVSRLGYGSNPGRDMWTDLAGCPRQSRLVGTTREGYLLGWNLDTISALPKVAYLPDLEPEYQRRVGATGARERGLQGVACSVNGFVATVGEGSDRYGEVQVWSTSGELLASSGETKTPHSGTGCRVAWDSTGEYLVTASASEYVAWLWRGGVLRAAARLALPHNLSMASGRPVVGAGPGRFVLLSSTGAWLYDVPTGAFIRQYGTSPAALRSETVEGSSQRQRPLLTYSAFFEQVLRSAGEPKLSENIFHPLFKVSTGREIELPDRKTVSSMSFYCAYGEGEDDFVKERTNCVRELPSAWEEFLEGKGLKLQLIADYNLPGWTRLVIAVSRSGKTQFRYLFESESNRSETMGYAKISILKQ